jgi:hypothetical protein
MREQEERNDLGCDLLRKVQQFAATASASSGFSNLPLTQPEEAIIIFVRIISPKKFKK